MLMLTPFKTGKALSEKTAILSGFILPEEVYCLLFREPAMLFDESHDIA